MPERIDIDEQIKCVAREAAMRKRVYQKRVDAGKMKPELATRETARMEAVLETLKAVKAIVSHPCQADAYLEVIDLCNVAPLPSQGVLV